MKLEGYSEQYLSILFDLPVKMINGESSDENKQEIQEIKSRCMDYLKEENDTLPEIRKKTVAKILGVDVRTIQRYCKKNSIK
jgi:ElaB/YqjD/DUF883 family membrane-anchored ribosome-binding protein